MGGVQTEDTVIVGASAAGLAVAACLRQRGRGSRLLEAADAVGATWRGHYDRLHLHTARGLSGLPGLPMPRTFPRYPARDQVVAYLEAYARHHALEPRFGARVTRIRRDGDAWITTTADGDLRSRHVVVATGFARVPNRPTWPDEPAFRGEILHSSAYANGARFAGKRVLVVGFGNSGGEIAIDLHEHGARPDLSVRGPVNILPRDVLGVPILALGIALAPLPPRLADLLSAPLRRVTVGRLDALGFQVGAEGPMAQIASRRRIPLLDVGTLRLVRGGSVRVRPGIERFTADGVRFVDGAAEPYDAIVVATGYRARVDEILGLDAPPGVLDADGAPTHSGQELAPGLWFCGFYVAPTGMLREIGREAERIAAGIAAAT